MSTADHLDHERIEELIAADVLDGLDESDRREMQARLSQHGLDCEACRRLLVEYGDAASGLAMALDPAPISAGAEERLVAAARAAPQEASDTAPRSTAPERGTGGRSAPDSGRTGRWLAGVAAAACLLLVAGLIGYRLAPSPGGRQEGFTHFVAQPGTKLVTLRGTDADVIITVAYRPGQSGGWIVGTNVPPPPSGKVYELWTQPGPNQAMAPAGLFVPRNGNVLAPVAVSGSLTLAAVTAEPAGGSSKPTSQPVYAGKPA